MPNTTAILVSTGVNAGSYASPTLTVDAYGRITAAANGAAGGGGTGITYTASATPPATANIGDQWYYTTSDILFERINDGTSNVWIDVSSSKLSSLTSTTIFDAFLLMGA